jgi:hypothetical protein
VTAIWLKEATSGVIDQLLPSMVEFIPSRVNFSPTDISLVLPSILIAPRIRLPSLVNAATSSLLVLTIEINLFLLIVGL